MHILRGVIWLLKTCACCVVKLPYRCVTSPCGMCRTTVNRRFTVLYLVMFFYILPRLCHNVRHSMFYSGGNATQTTERFIRENTERIKEADNYFKMLNESGRVIKTSYGGIDTFSATQQRAIKVALTVITVSRNRHAINKYEPRYLSQVIYKYLMLIDEESKSADNQLLLHLELSVCNVDHDPTSYDEAINIAHFVPTFQRFKTRHFSMVHVLEKEKQDYVFCLNRSLASKPDYVFLVEDDALPTDDMFTVLRHVLYNHVESGHERGEIVPRRSPSLAYVKFYHPERLLNFFSLEQERLLELFSYAALFGLLLTGLYLLCFRIDTPLTVYVLWRRMATFSLLVCLAVGRSGFLELRRFASPALYMYTPAPSCCTPAMVFPQLAAHQVVNFLIASECSNTVGKDTLLDRMLLEHHMAAYLVQPNVFTHIGMYSSLRERLVDPFLV